MVYKSTNATISENTSWHNHLDTHSTKGIWRTELQTQASDNITWINNTAVADQTVSPYNAAIGSFSFTGDTNTGIVWRGNTTFDGQAGDPSFRTNGGNSGPSAALNKLGVNPGLDYSDIMALARSLGSASRGDPRPRGAGAINSDALGRRGRRQRRQHALLQGRQQGPRGARGRGCLPFRRRMGQRHQGRQDPRPRLRREGRDGVPRLRLGDIRVGAGARGLRRGQGGHRRTRWPTCGRW